ncbi:low temperature requirement protein LtrA [Nonomuraea soli]|uniref:Low temperature requirement protein LtrA n=2 Tax=Nonomuraea soli TaxID=1032476 RepID=A0A7W0CF97_9ACTN|nr:low temperature requirement protein LtrA [Nonomuraea soli]
MVVLGESVVAIGIGAHSPDGHAVDLPLALGVVLGIAIAAGLWWVYFDSAEVRAGERRRQLLAYYAFTGAHLIMIIGVILVAAACVVDARANPSQSEPWAGAIIASLTDDLDLALAGRAGTCHFARLTDLSQRQKADGSPALSRAANHQESIRWEVSAGSSETASSAWGA